MIKYSNINRLNKMKIHSFISKPKNKKSWLFLFKIYDSLIISAISLAFLHTFFKYKYLNDMWRAFKKR